MRAAIYARYSSDMQNPVSIEDQIRKCRQYADSKGWTVLDDFVLSDAGVSGASIHQREGLKALIALSDAKPRPFDLLLIDDTSRLGRNLTDVLKISDHFKDQDVFLYFVSQHLDSRDPGFRQNLIFHGMMDEHVLTDIADKVHRGQEGRILRGQVAGGRCFGYKHVPIEDPSRRGEYGRPAVIGVRQEVDEEEAKVVRRIFKMCAEGSSLSTIAKTLNGEKVPAPRPRIGRIPAWSPHGIHSMLRNERYRGRVIWNRSKQARISKTGKRKKKPRPEQEWVRVEVPELRIVTDAQWDLTHEQIKRKAERFGPQRLGGILRVAHRREYLFSGLLICAVCGYRITIVSGSRNYALYGCPIHRYRGGCPNDLMIRHDLLEQQLIDALTARFLQPEILERTILEFQNQVQRNLADFLEDRKRAISEAPRLKSELRKLETEASNLGGAIAEFGSHRSPTLLSRLGYVEDQIGVVRGRLEVDFPEPQPVPIDRLRHFVLEQSERLKSVLLQDRATAKLALRTHFKPLVLTPKATLTGPVYSVEGVFDLFSGLEDVMLLVAPQGFEPRLIGSEPTVLPLNERATQVENWQLQARAGATISRLIECTGPA
jgi:site-specific DNA recombinase